MNRTKHCLLVAGLGIGLLGGGPAAAQVPLNPASSSTPATVAEREAARERLYEELAGEVEFLQRMGSLLKQVARIAKPSVVHVEAQKTERNGGRSEHFEEAGSGVVLRLNDRLYVVTNRHVILGSPNEDILLRTSEGRELRPTKVISDSTTDVAVLAVEESPDLLPARLGDSGEVEIGDFVIAIGSPFGLSHSVTFGIISAKGRRDLALGDKAIELQDFFQTDAAINPGNSGGPLLNLRGEVVGLNTAIASSSGGSEGIGFAIPINMVRLVARQLVEDGRLRRAYLGVSLDPDFSSADALSIGVQRPGGARVKRVESDSPAQQARLRDGDVIVEFDGVWIEDDSHLVNQVGLTPVGKEVTVVLYREGRPYRVSVTLVALP